MYRIKFLASQISSVKILLLPNNDWLDSVSNLLSIFYLSILVCIPLVSLEGSEKAHLFHVLDDRVLPAYLKKIGSLPHGSAVISAFHQLEKAKEDILRTDLISENTMKQFTLKMNDTVYRIRHDLIKEDTELRKAEPIIGKPRQELDRLCRFFCIDPTTVSAVWVPETDNPVTLFSLDKTVAMSVWSYKKIKETPNLIFGSLGHELVHFMCRTGAEQEALEKIYLKDSRFKSIYSKDYAQTATAMRLAQFNKLSELQADILGAAGSLKYMRAVADDFKRSAGMTKKVKSYIRTHPSDSTRAILLYEIIAQVWVPPTLPQKSMLCYITTKDQQKTQRGWKKSGRSWQIWQSWKQENKPKLQL